MVDTIVFGRDMDLSGDTQYDEDFIAMFKGSAGKGTWELPGAESQGPRMYPEAAEAIQRSVGPIPAGGPPPRVQKVKTYGNGPGQSPTYEFPAPPPVKRSGKQFGKTRHARRPR